MVWKKRGRANSCEVCDGAVIVKNNIRSRGENRFGLDWKMEEQPKKRKADWIGLGCIGMEWKMEEQPKKRKADWIGLDWIGLDWIGFDWIGMEDGRTAEET
jgi:hypothetical protein